WCRSSRDVDVPSDRRPALVFIAIVAIVRAFDRTGQVAGQQPGADQVAHVVLVGVDGLSPEGIRRAGTPRLDALMASGSWTLHARGVIPTVSSPNWASMLSGAGPDRHGVTSNDWQPDRHGVPPVATGSGRIFPTIVGELHKARPHAVIAVFHDWDG